MAGVRESSHRFSQALRSVYALPVRDEIHSAEFLNGRIHAVGGGAIARHVRLAILRNTIDELAKINFISITNVVINKTGKPLGYDVFAAAWGTLFQRFENTLTHGNFPGGFRNDYGIPHDGRLGSGSRNIPIVRVIEDPHGKDSAETLPIQMCDVCAYFLLQRFRPNAYVRRQRAQHYFDRLHPVLNHRASRYDSLGIVNL